VGEIMSAVKLAAHLGFQSDLHSKLEEAGAISRLPCGGYSLDASRIGYIRH